MALSGTFDCIPRSILSNQSVRFLPSFTFGSTPALAGATAFYWQFGDGATSYDWTPVHVYPVVTGASPYNVTLTVQDSSFATYSTTISWAVMQDISDNVDAVPNDGTFSAVSLLVYDDSNSMMVTRGTWSGCSLNLLTPVVTQTLDKIGTLTFSLLDVGNSSAERSLMVEGANVVFFQGTSVVFSGIIRRVSQNTQNGFDAVTRVRLWDFECDSDLARLSKLNVVTDTGASSRVIIDSPGNIARTILAPAVGERDSRGIINCVDSNVYFSLNHTSTAESTGDRYSNLMKLQASTNYDLRSRPDYLIYEFSSFDMATAFTFAGVAWDTDEFSDSYLAVVGATPHGVRTYGKISANNSSTIFSSSLVGAGNSPTTGFAIIHRGYLIDFANDLSQPSPVRWYEINNDVYNFTDNDDKRKLNTKVVVGGKDINGDNISVSVSGVHAYNDDRQFFNDSTSISTPSEGYVVKHTLADKAAASTVVLPSNTDFYYESAPNNSILVLYGGTTKCPIGATVDFVGVNLPTEITAGTVYYIVEGNSIYVRVSASENGAAISCTGGAGGGNFTGKVYLREAIFSYTGNQVFAEDDACTITSTSEPTGLTNGAAYWIDDHRYIGTRSGTAWNSGAFRLSYLGPGTAHAAPTTTGSGVYVYTFKDVKNSPSSGAACAVWLYGWGYTISSDLTYSLVVPNSTTYVDVTTSGTNTEEVLPDGTLATKVMMGIGKMIVGTTDYGGRGYFMSPRLFVKDNFIGANEVLIGEEKITISAIGNHATYGNYINIGTAHDRISSSTKKCYPHGAGALVARTNYTEATPETYSIVSDYGLRISSDVVETNTTFGALDTYATNLLLGFGAFYKIASCYTTIVNSYCKRVGEWYNGQQATLSTQLRVGDRLSFTEYSGATPETYQIVSLTIIYDEGRVVFSLGDFEKNVFTSLDRKTSALNRTLT